MPTIAHWPGHIKPTVPVITLHILVTSWPPLRVARGECARPTRQRQHLPTLIGQRTGSSSASFCTGNFSSAGCAAVVSAKPADELSATIRYRPD